ncbi:nucleotidyltransferase [Telmatocola sphagniphila]|uniref:Nucleotidyltransferase n=1 Tax=Telmatocola sphagniphila TaxID=1123043 RepID=A0A8E6B5A1_9BACT|nr:nucleotidyltransferase [Telmatocola sphagniphila]QVL31554.1 nucleotidyltransferase [Telmatocola sphagniphila]
MARPLIAHLDADCFYVSAERVRFPWLRGKPVGVLGNQGACVIAKSYEMKAAGVKTGTTVWEAQALCPEGIYVKRDFRWYEVLSRDMLEIVRRYSSCSEFYSIDEFFFTVDDPSPQLLAQKIQQEISNQIGVPVTIGVARSRTLAKLISDTAKPFGAKALFTPEEERELLARLSVSEITGIASRRAKTLMDRGIRTCLDFINADRKLILQLITKVGEGLWYELRGEPVIRINTERTPHKFLSRGGSMAGKVYDPRVLHAWLVRNVERLIEELNWYQVHAGKLTLFLSYADDRPSLGGEGPLDGPTDRFDELLESAKVALARAYRPGWVATHMHVIAGDLRRAGCRQASLFPPPEEPAKAVAEIKKKINERIGRFAVRSAATLPLREIYSDTTHSFDICDIKGKTCF